MDPFGPVGVGAGGSIRSDSTEYVLVSSAEVVEEVIDCGAGLACRSATGESFEARESENQKEASVSTAKQNLQ